MCALREASCSVLYNPRKSKGFSTLDTSPGMSHLTMPVPWNREKYNCFLQFGGSDQWGNITNGCDLVKKLS